MMFPAFADYNLYEVGATDSIRAKWDGVKNAKSAIVGPADLGISALGAWNLSINRQIHYVGEPPGIDNWQAPYFTWANKTGDCEDYAILKFMALHAICPVALVVGELKSTLKANPQHAWCAAKLGDTWYAFDSMFDHLVTVDYYLAVNFIPLAACQGDHVVRYGKAFRIADISTPRSRA
jgi:hypothetical protein